MYKNFNRIYKKIILIILISYRINAKTYDCLPLCCPCLFDIKSEDDSEKFLENKIGNKSKSENENENELKEKKEIKKFLQEYRSNEKYKKEKKTTEKSSIIPNYENYIKAFNDIDKRLGDYFKKEEYTFADDYTDSCSCIFYFFYKKEIKDILQIGDYCVTFDTEKNLHLNKDLVEALSIKEDDEIKYYSSKIKELKENNEKVDEETASYYLSYPKLYIYSNEDKKYIGGILFQPENSGKDPLTFNIAYWLNYNYRGLGIMSVIVPTICKYFFTRIKQIRGYSFFWDKKNSKSAGLAEKTCNFISTGHEKEYEIKEEDYKDEGKEEICITKKINYY